MKHGIRRFSNRGGKRDSSEEEGKEIHAPEIRKYIHSGCMQGFSPETVNTFLRINSMEQ
jgi:hypothetical protein